MEKTHNPPELLVQVSEGPIKVLFLDIDGVLNSTKTFYAFNGFPADFKEIGKFDWAAISLLQRMCKVDPTLRIVLSSSWRLSSTAEEAAKALGLPIIDVTPGDDTEKRGVEIQQWLDAHPKVKIYAILDDNNWMLPHQQGHFVKTNEEDGLTFKDVRKLLGRLSIPIGVFMSYRPDEVGALYRFQLPGAETEAKKKDSGWSPLPDGVEFLDKNSSNPKYEQSEAGFFIPKIPSKMPYER